MKTYFTVFVFSLFFFPSSILVGQTTHSDLDLIKDAVENYYYGYINRDIDRLRLAFDTANGTMKLPKQTPEGETIYENGYFKDIVPSWGSRDKLSQEVLDKSSLKVLNIEVIEGQMGIAKIKMKVGDQVYLDVLSLQKIGEQWKITNKMFVAF